MRHLSLLVLLTSFVTTISAQIVTETFTYPDGDLVGQGGWSAHSGAGNNSVQVSSGEITIQHGGGSREDVNISFAAVTTGTIYASFDFRVSDLGAPYVGSSNEYFAHFNFSSNFTNRIDIAEPAGSGDFSLGITTAASSTRTSWGSDLLFDTVYTLVMSYNFDTDLSTLWINPSSETDPSVSGASATVSSINGFSFRQANSSEDETIIVDNLRVGTEFAHVIPEPSTYALIFGGLTLGVALFVKRRRIKDEAAA